MKYVKKASCPASLKRIIDLINTLPEDVQAASRELKEFGFRYSERISIDEQIEDIVGSSYIKDYLLESAGETFNFEELNEYFCDLVKTKQLFEEIARTYKKPQLDRWGKIYFVREQFNRSTSLKFEVGLTIDEKGFIKPRYNELLKLFKDDISPDRIRVCEVCSSIFWAKKINAETCGEKNCASTLHNRKRIARTQKEREDEAKVKELNEALRKQKWDERKNRDFSRKDDN